MHHRVEYFRSADGASIAAARAGEGPPLLLVPAMVDSIETTFARYAEGFPDREVVTYDRRGTGLSERGAVGERPEVFVEDAQAVLDGFGLEGLPVLGTLLGGVEAAALAALNPGRVAKLVLRSPVVSLADWAEIPAVRAALASMEQDWDYFTESFSQLVVGWGNPGATAMAAGFREITTRDELRRVLDGLRELDLTASYPAVRAETLIEHRTDYFFPRSYTRRIAALIPDCRLEIYEGAASAFVHDFSIARDFLAGDVAESATTGFQTILVTDLESSTALTQRLGDEAAQELLERHDAIVREALLQHGGREVKHTGDGIMATFGSPVAALEAGLQARQQLAEREIGAHIGLNSGEPVARDGDLFGTAVQLAFRIADHAGAGQVLVSNVVRELCAGKRFRFRPLDEASLKGFEQPVVLYEADDRS